MRLIIVIILIVVFSSSVKSQSGDARLLYSLLKQNSKQFKVAWDRKKNYEVQIIYTQIDRDEKNIPHFTTYQFDVDTSRYFYPASTVKLPVALLALEKLDDINLPSVTKYTPMYHDSIYPGQLWVKADTTSEGGVASIAHYIKKVFVVSDNDAFNRLYEFVGQKEINEKLKGKGYNIRILHRLTRKATPDQNRHTEAIRFADRDTVYFSQPMLVNDSMIVDNKVIKGKGYYDEGKLIRKPFDFSYRNYFSISDQHEMLKAVIFPQSVASQKRFNIQEDDRKMVLQYMSQLPAETLYPPYYKDTAYVDAYGKLFLYGSESASIPDNIRIFNKIGFAYGYAIDNAYIVDFDSRIEFMLTAVIYTNKNQILNDDNYEYRTIGFPFMKNLGQLIYDFEKTRLKKHLPDLSEFRFEYELKRQEYK